MRVKLSSSCVAIGLVQCEAALGEEIREKITRLKWCRLSGAWTTERVGLDDAVRAGRVDARV